MVKQLFLPLAAVAVFIFLVGTLVKSPEKLGFKVQSSPSPEQNQKLTIGSKTIDIEIANTPELRNKGLSGRTSLDESSGMLFVFDTQDVSPIFWMKDMLIPLDIIWIDDDKVVSINKNVQAPKAGTLDRDLEKYTPPTNVDYVLEVTAGFSDKNNIKIGDETKFDL